MSNHTSSTAPAGLPAMGSLLADRESSAADPRRRTA
jgi:hypothetical protein